MPSTQSYTSGEVENKLREQVRSLGSTIRDQSRALGMSHATLQRRLVDPGSFTVAELHSLARALLGRLYVIIR